MNGHNFIIMVAPIHFKSTISKIKSLFKFSNKVMLYHLLLSLFPACFPDFIRQIARYLPHKVRKTSSKTIRKINLSKI